MRVLAGDADDLVIVNSCAVTNEAVRQTRQAIRKAKRARPDARMFVTGCAAQVEPRDVRGDARGGPGARQSREVRRRGLASRTERVRVSDIMAVRETAPHLVAGFAERAAPSSRCRMAATIAAPSASSLMGRGNSRSVPAGLVVERIKALVERGLSRGGADRRRRDQLRPGPARRADARPADRAHPAPRPGAAAPPPVLARLHRDGRQAVRAGRRTSRASCRTSI